MDSGKARAMTAQEMTAQDRDGDDRLLDGLFAEARAAAPRPGPALTARVLADARGELGRRRPAVRRAAAPAGPGALLAALVAGFGGRGALAGMVAAGAAGLWIGLAAPGPVAAALPGLVGAPADGMEDVPDVEAILAIAAEG